MKKIAKLLFASAALLVAFVSCQKVEEVTVAPKVTHTVRFTTEMPTKTSYVVEENSVKYSWEDGDKDRLHVFDGEEEGTINSFNIDEETGVLRLEVSFNGSSEGSHTYTAYLNGAVKSEQVETSAGSYDPTCDVLVAKPIQSSELGEGSAYTFYFRRPVAITELKLKGLKEEETVSKVTIISDSEHPIAGKYTQSSTDDSTGEWSESSNKIVVSFSEAKTVGSDGILPLSIVTRPIKEASVKVLVETTDGKKYRKVTASALTLFADVVKVQGIGLTPVTEAEHTDAGWYLVTNASELFDGDEIRIACPSENKMAGDIATDENGKILTYLADCEVSFDEGKLTGVTPGSEPKIFTLCEGYDKWNITTANGKLGATAVKVMKYDDGTLDWGIGIGDEGVASISSATDGYGDIKYNKQSPRFLNYASGQTDIQIFKKYGVAVDPIIKTARTASFSSETATVTIGAQDNEFPELSFEPAEATEGTQTWTSSNTEVATVDATSGDVTLVSDGTTTIKVEIAESDTYQPCSAEYVLTVKPAPVQGLDIIDNDFVGTPSSYASWKDKTSSSSGKTYAGNSTTQQNSNNIQMRATNPSGIVVTASDGGKVARKITVKWNTSTDRTIDIYGKDSAYSSENGASDLYESSKAGDKLGSIKYGESTELVISGDYEFIGLRSNSGALYVESISIQWEDAKPGYTACFKNGDDAVEEVNGTVGETFTAPTLSIDGGLTPSVSYESSNQYVATVDAETGAVTLKKKGDATITATLDGDDTHRTTKVSYTIHVANKLSSIKLAEDSEQSTTFYVGQGFSFAGIKLEAEYNDGEKKTLTADDLTADNFSGFDSSAAVESQTITVSYTDGETETTTYNVEIKPLVTLYGITVPAEDANGNSITVKGGLTEAPEGGEIELNVNLNNEKGYKLTSLKVNEAEHSADVKEGKYTFTMPAEAVTVTATFDNHYTVTLTQPSANGTVKVKGETTSHQSIACGETVSVLAVPETGYELDSWTINGAELTDATNASTTFTMPANNVTITASFKKHIETQKITLTAADVTDFESSYKEYAWSVNGVTGNMWAYRGGSSGSYSMQFNKTTYVKNTTAVPGRIKSITMTKVSGTDRTWSVYVGATALTSTTGATQVESAKEVSSETKWTVTSGDYYYFYLTKADGGTNIGSIVIEYEPSGDVPSTTKLSTPTDLTWTEGTKTLSWDNKNTSNGTYGTDYKYQYRIGSDGSWTDATSDIKAVLTITETKTVYVKAVAINTTAYSDSDLTGGTSCTISSGGGTVTWTRVTTIAELTAGGTFIMGYEATAKSGVIVPLRSADCNAKTTANGYFNTGTTAGSSTNGTIDMSKLTESADYEVYISSPASGKINIQMKDQDGSYYGATSGGSTKNSGRLCTSGNSAETNLTPEFSSETNNQFKLTSDVTGQYKYLKYNTGSPRFAYYNSADSNIVFYKKSN